MWGVTVGGFAPRTLSHCSLADCSITKFLNRILGLEVDKQNMLFQYFSDTFDYLIEKDKKEGKYDMGILGVEKRGGQTSPCCTPRFSVPPRAACWQCHNISGTVVSPHSTGPETRAGKGGGTRRCPLQQLFSCRLSPRSG